MLVRALEVEVRPDAPTLSRLHHRLPRRPAVKPHVHGVATLCVRPPVGAVLGCKQLVGGESPPAVGAVCADKGEDVCEGRVCEERVARVLVVEDGNGNTPAALAANAPLIPLLEHTSQPPLARLGNHLLCVFVCVFVFVCVCVCVRVCVCVCTCVKREE